MSAERINIMVALVPGNTVFLQLSDDSKPLAHVNMDKATAEKIGRQILEMAELIPPETRQ